MDQNSDYLSLYLHIPFCRHRCSYCDFNTFAHQERWIPPYGEAICKEIVLVSGSQPGQMPVHTIFFGGGTPSLLPVEVFGRIFATIRARFDVLPGAEITIEVNPGTVTARYLQDLRKLGVNRLSFGMQSAHPDDLRTLERQHDYFDVVRAIQWARQAGFDNLSLDLIFGLPEQSMERWQDTVERAIELGTEHLSLYALTIEHGTPLEKRYRHGLVPVPDGDLAADMYEFAMERLEAAGFCQYEISNWACAKPEGDLFTCRHNLQYWYNRPYLGLGAGAHGFAGGVRTMNVGGIKPYVDRCEASSETYTFPAGPATRRTIKVDAFTEMQETMMVGLRLTIEGVSARGFAERFGKTLEEVFVKEIDPLVRAGLLEWAQFEDGAHLRLTRRGRLLGNQVFIRFVGE